MRAGTILIGLFIVVSVQAGVLVIDTEAPQIHVGWIQGVERSTVHFTNHEVYRYNMTLMSGPNQCFVIGADGNDRAILIEPESDDIGPFTPDAIVDCRICGCEDSSNTRFTCRSDGRCVACDPCSDLTCGDGEVCIRSTCDTAACSCDPVLCSGRTCEGSVSVTDRCASDRCVTERTCIENECGAQCTSGMRVVRTYCDDDLLMHELTTCTSSCTEHVQTRIEADCSERDCPLGQLPRCTSGGCACV